MRRAARASGETPHQSAKSDIEGDSFEPDFQDNFSSSHRGESIFRNNRKFRAEDDEISVVSQMSTRKFRQRKPTNETTTGESTEEIRNLRSQLVATSTQVKQLENELKKEKDNSQHADSLNDRLRVAEDERDKLGRLLAEEAAKTKKLEAVQNKLKMSSNELSMEAIKECKDLSSALTIERQRNENLSATKSELSQLLEAESLRLKSIEEENSKIQRHYDAERLLTSEKKRNELFEEAQEQLHQALEGEKKIGDIFAGKNLSRDPQEAMEQKLSIVQQHMQCVEKASTSTRLRLIKTQKLFNLERERAEFLEDELRKLDGEIRDLNGRNVQFDVVEEQFLAKLKQMEEQCQSLNQICSEQQICIDTERAKQQDFRDLITSIEKISQENISKEKDRSRMLDLRISEFEIQTSRLMSDVDAKTEAYRSLSKEFDALKATQTQLTVDLEDAKVDVVLKNRNCSKLEEEIKSLKVTLGETGKQIQDGKEREQKLTSQNVEKSQAIEGFKARNNELQVQGEKLQKIISIIEADLSKTKDELSQSQKATKDRDESLKVMQQKLDEKVAEISRLEASLQDTQKTIESQKDTLQERLESLQERTKQLEESEGALKSEQSALREAQSEVDSLKKKTSGLLEEIESLTKTLADERSEKEETQKRLETAEETLSQVKEEAQASEGSFKQQIADLAKTVSSGEGTIEELKSENADLAKKIEDLTAALEKEKKEVKTSTDLQEKLQKNIGSLQSDLQASTEECATLKSRVSSLESEVENKKGEADSHMTKLEEVTKEQNEKNEHLETKIKEGSKHRSLVENAFQAHKRESDDKIKALQKELFDLNDTLAKKESVLEYEKETLEALEEMYNEQQVQLDETRSGREKLEADKQIMEEHVRSLLDDLEAHKQVIDVRDSELQRLQGSLDKTSKLLEAEESARKTLEGEKANLELSDEAARKAIKSLEASVDKRDVIIEEWKEKLANATNENSDLSSDIEGLEKSMEDALTSIRNSLSVEKESSAPTAREVEVILAEIQRRRLEVVKRALGIRHRDQLLVRVLDCLNRKLAEEGKNASIPMLQEFVGELTQKTGLTFYDPHARDYNTTVSVYRGSDSQGSNAFGMGRTIPLVPLVTLAQNTPRDSVKIQAPMFSMLGARR